MNELVSPKQVAQAIGVSESSLKRWCDQGLIETVRTAGGHRRLPVKAVLSFLQESGHPLVEPEILGLPSLTAGAGTRSLGRAHAALCEALIAGQEEAARQVVIDAFIAKHPIHELADHVIAPAFHEIGRRWGCGDLAVYQERRACDIAVRILSDLRRMTKSPPASSARAIGGTLEGDHYCLPNGLAELVVRQAGWEACSVGANIPVDSFVQAVEQQQPQLIWLSVSFYRDADELVSRIQALHQAALPKQTPILVGGRAITTAIRDQLPTTAFCNSMQQLDEMARSLIASASL